MILYQLGCTNDHSFESWFRDSAAFDHQVARGLLSCPVCGSGGVSKSIMAPAVVGASGKREAQKDIEPVAARDGMLLDAKHQAIRAALRAIRSKILAEGHDVGTRFPEEARLMHEGAIPVQPIHGQATPDEARGLLEDGIMILPIPTVPEELN